MKKYIFRPGYSQLTWFVKSILEDEEFRDAKIGTRVYNNHHGMVSYYKRDGIIAELCIKADSRSGWKNKDFIITIDNVSYYVKNTGLKRTEATKCGYKTNHVNKCLCFIYNLTSISQDDIEKLGVDKLKFMRHVDCDGNGIITIETISEIKKTDSDKYLEMLEKDEFTIIDFVDMAKIIYMTSKRYKKFFNLFLKDLKLNMRRVKAIEYFENLQDDEIITLKESSDKLNLAVSMVDWASCCDKGFRKHFAKRGK